MKQTNRIKNVIVAVDLSDASWRDFLTGFFNFARTGVHWNIKLIQSQPELSSTIQNSNVLLKTDGIVTGIPLDEAAAATLDETKLPVILVGMEDSLLRKASHLVIRNDNEDIGSLAARHFLSLGNFSSFGFVTTQANEPWSKLRGNGFRKEVPEHLFHHFKSPFPSGSEEDLSRLAKWARKLPKPAAVFVAYDRRAIHLLTACKEANIPVPAQIAVIGVDNDRLLCDFADPPLTSVAPDHEDEGHVAAQSLAEMMDKRHRIRQRQILITGKRIIERESAIPTSPSASLVRRAVNFITLSACKNIKAGDVAEQLKVSRSLLDMRFKEINGTTLASFIAETRLAEVKRRLRDTKKSIRNISRECNFSSPNHLKNLFKRHIGISMREYRKAKP